MMQVADSPTRLRGTPKRLRNLRSPVSTSLCTEQAKENTAWEAQLCYSCPARAFLRDSGALRTFAVSVRIFVARFLRGCSVLSSLTPARLGVYVSGLDAKILETSRTLDRKTLLRAGPPTSTSVELRPI